MSSVSSAVINGRCYSHYRIIIVYKCVTLCQCQIVCAALEYDKSTVSNFLDLLSDYLHRGGSDDVGSLLTEKSFKVSSFIGRHDTCYQFLLKQQIDGNISKISRKYL